MKFGRLYTMAVEGASGETHYISFPLTCVFQVIKQVTFNSGHAVFRVYNLSSDVRSDIYQDVFQIGSYRKITFAAGYEGEELPQIFQGNIKQAYSYRAGPDWITEIEAWDGGSAIESAISNITVPQGYSVSQLARQIIDSMGSYHVETGAIGDIDAAVPSSRGITLCGNAWDLITRTLKPEGGFAFINNERVNIVNQWEYIVNEGGIEEISNETGMIGTPRLQQAFVTASMIYEPRIEPQQSVQLVTTESRMTGRYTALRIIHQGTISGAVAGSLTTDVTLYQPDRDLSPVAAQILSGAAL